MQTKGRVSYLVSEPILLVPTKLPSENPREALQVHCGMRQQPCNAMPATLGTLGFYWRCCFHGFENYCVASEIYHCRIEACVAAYK